MSYIDRMGSQDPQKLLALGASLSLGLSLSSNASSYNLPLFVFGIVAIEMQNTTYPLRNFTSLLGFSIILDIIKLLTPNFTFITFFLTVILFLLKLPTFFSVLVALRGKGDDIAVAIPFMDRGSGGGGGGGWSLPTSFPGSFPGQGQTQTQANNASHHSQTAPPSAPQFPSGGGFTLGTADAEEGGHPTAPGQGRGGYQTLG